MYGRKPLVGAGFALTLALAAAAALFLVAIVMTRVVDTFHGLLRFVIQ